MTTSETDQRPAHDADGAAAIAFAHEVTVATAAHGLATGFADTGTVGVSGMHVWPPPEDETRAAVKAFMTAVVAGPADSLRTSEA